MITSDWLCDTQLDRPVGASIVPVIGAFKITHFSDCSGDQHPWSMYLKIDNIQNHIPCTPSQHVCILIGLIPYPVKTPNKINMEGHSVVGTIISPFLNLDMAGPCLKWNCADVFQWQCYPPLADWLRVHPEYVIIAEVSDGS
jgi:hypothetical protein